jgi:hypothetical protein
MNLQKTNIIDVEQLLSDARAENIVFKRDQIPVFSSMKMESHIDCVMDSFSDLYIRCRTLYANTNYLANAEMAI